MVPPLFWNSTGTVKKSSCRGVQDRVTIYRLNVSQHVYQDAIIKRIDWEGTGLNIDGEYLSHLIFTDDIILFAKSPEKLTSILTDIHNTSKPAGLNMHLGKTKVMFNEHAEKCTITVNGKNIKEVDSFVYLGNTVTKDCDLLPEIRKRIALGWADLVTWITSWVAARQASI